MKRRNNITYNYLPLHSTKSKLTLHSNFNNIIIWNFFDMGDQSITKSKNQKNWFRKANQYLYII